MEPEGFESSWEERQAVARDECRLSGHTFTELVVHGSLAPVAVVCRRCGSAWHIHPDDQGRNFTGARSEHYGS